MNEAAFVCTVFFSLFFAGFAAPDRVTRGGPGQHRAPRPAPYALANNNRPGPIESRQGHGGAGRDDPWQLPRIPRLSGAQVVHGRPVTVSNPTPQPTQGTSRWSDGIQAVGNGRPAQRGPPRAPQVAAVEDERRFITSTPEVHLPVASRRFFSPQPAIPRRLTPEEMRERQNIETQRAVAHNSWQQYLRDRVISLGYRTAGEAWPRSTTFMAGQFTAEEIEEQSQYARWCRDTLLGFERYSNLTLVLFNSDTFLIIFY